MLMGIVLWCPRRPTNGIKFTLLYLVYLIDYPGTDEKKYDKCQTPEKMPNTSMSFLHIELNKGKAMPTTDFGNKANKTLCD